MGERGPEERERIHAIRSKLKELSQKEAHHRDHINALCRKIGVTQEKKDQLNQKDKIMSHRLKLFDIYAQTNKLKKELKSLEE
jgi:hypothetical protein